PIKQSKVVKERGNRAYRYIRKLIEQELIEGKKSGRTRILTTTSKFRDYFQIQDLRELVKEEAEKVEEIEW
ncbi:MAG TPA: SMC-Scp complex subunit ScpB, partial [Candidatus Altiarchaeales archaeon]|nr:SMC-Scp complex subunit ScpB [Candidatus Altiarchaeales archaeon]